MTFDKYFYAEMTFDGLHITMELSDVYTEL